MRPVLTFVCLLILTTTAVATPETSNANSRYTIESVEVVPQPASRLSKSLRNDLHQLVGDKFDAEVLNAIARRIRTEARARMVIQRFSRGSQPERIKVVFEIVRRRDFDLNATRLAYQSRQGWSGGLDATVRWGANAVTAGVFSDNDELLERYAGIHGRYERSELLDRRLGFSFEAGTFHEQWNPSTLASLGPIPVGNDEVSGVYRTRQRFSPVMSVRLARPLTLSTGVDVERFETQFPAARTESANSVVNTLRYQESWEGTGTSQKLEAAYNLRAATRTLGSDYVYARHEVTARYDASRGNSGLRLLAMAGTMNGRAPLFERFVLGTSTTLRGWSKYELQPLGGSRVAYGSAEYRYRVFHAFYDVGALWNRTESGDVKHAIGAGLHTGSLYFSVGFPVREGRATPIFIIAMSF